jgi:integrase
MMSKRILEHEALDGLVFRGIRKAAATRLADVGCTEHEIMSITGRTSLSEVQRYTQAANQKRLARSAMEKVRLYGQNENTALRTASQ